MNCFAKDLPIYAYICAYDGEMVGRLISYKKQYSSSSGVTRILEQHEGSPTTSCSGIGCYLDGGAANAAFHKNRMKTYQKKTPRHWPCWYHNGDIEGLVLLLM